MVGRARDAEPEALVQHLVVPRGLVVRVQQDVRMSLHQSGHQRRPRQVHGGRPCGAHAGRGSGGLDAIAADADGPPFVHRVAVEDAGRPKHGDDGVRAARAGRALGLCEQRQRNQQQRRQGKAAHDAP